MLSDAGRNRWFAALLSGALLTGAWLLDPSAARAGEVNLTSRSTLIVESISASTVDSGSSQSISSTGISGSSAGGSTTEVISRSITISEGFAGTSATVSFEVAQEDINYTSPFDNLHIVGSILQSITASGAGIMNVQTTAGAGNVSIASNGLIDGVTLASITGTLNTSTNAAGAQVAALALTPGFALQNSNANALTQAAAMAIAQGQVGLNVTAIDVTQSGLNEYSPNNNVALHGAFLDQNVNAEGVVGIGNVQTQAGAGNVQAPHTVILFNPGVDGSAALFQ